jgi:phosphate:acyl-[acyl carrier protein] acyltransferase
MSVNGMVTLAVDAMSGDHGSEPLIDGCLRALERLPELRLILVGDSATLRPLLASRRHATDARIQLEHAPEVVAMDELPSRALRTKKLSSMRVAIDLVKHGRAQACVSAGNTGALMGIARFVLKTLPGVDRPAIISPLPTLRGVTHVLDLGANAECTPQHLQQFAVMGSALVTALHGIEQPRVALLNIGAEEIKGNDTIKQAAALLTASPIHYTGFIEGDGVFLDPVDVVVCDGFVGNVALKAGEGVAKLMASFMREEFTRDLGSKLIGLMAQSVLHRLGKRMDPRRYNGASFLGLRATVVKSHGSADAVAFCNAIKVAVHEVEQQVPERITRMLAEAGVRSEQAAALAAQS